MKSINSDIISLGRDQYKSIIGYDDAKKDSDGFLVLVPTADHVDKKVETLTTDISTLESKLKAFRAEKEKAVKYQKSDEYKEDKKKSGKKKHKKQRNTLLEMVFNKTSDDEEDEEIDEEDEENYRDKKVRKKPEKKKEAQTTLDTTYGKRFSPVVSLLYDTISDFDEIAKSIEEELNNQRSNTKSMYRSSQISNMISAKSSKLSAVKELASVAKTISDLEYKKEKDKKTEDGSDTSKAISSLGAKYLRGAFELDDKKNKKGKKKDKDKDASSFKKSAAKLGTIDLDDDDDDGISIKKDERSRNDNALAEEFASAILKNKDSMHFTAHEKYMSMEGKYAFVVACDPLDVTDYKFIAVDPKTGKEIKGFKDDYKELMPKKKSVQLNIDINKKKAYDKLSGRSYKVVFY